MAWNIYDTPLWESLLKEKGYQGAVAAYAREKGISEAKVTSMYAKSSSDFLTVMWNDIQYRMEDAKKAYGTLPIEERGDAKVKKAFDVEMDVLDMLADSVLRARAKAVAAFSLAECVNSGAKVFYGESNVRMISNSSLEETLKPLGEFYKVESQAKDGKFVYSIEGIISESVLDEAARKFLPDGHRWETLRHGPYKGRHVIRNKEGLVVGGSVPRDYKDSLNQRFKERQAQRKEATDSSAILTPLVPLVSKEDDDEEDMATRHV